MIKRIVVEPSGYHCLNMGDVAMMQVAVARLSELWPHAEIEVVIGRPDLLRRYCPSAVPLAVEARNAWLSGRSLIGGVHRRLPSRVSAMLQGLEGLLWLRCPAVTELGVRLRAAILRRTPPSPSSFRKRLTGADLLVVSGAGGFNDAFADSALPLLDELEFALRAGIPVVAFGQGVGPIADPALLAKARTVLPRFALISLREGRTGLPLLESLGVPRDRIHVTGDDAVELAFQRRPSSLGDAIGVNLRLAGYAETGDDTVGKLHDPLLSAAQALNASLVPVPISLHASDSDVRSADRLLGGQNHGSPLSVETPEDVIRLIGKCRVVVTGSYHGGVFALAQGIPVVGLVQSPYYEQKFTGLEVQFPAGCRAIDLRRPVTPGEIEDAILGAWESAERVRGSLLEAAARQIELSRAAYRAARALTAARMESE
jgi:colanic acid/amylovoran biosynthesis protein